MTNAQIAEALEELAVLYQLDEPTATGFSPIRTRPGRSATRASVEEMARNGTVTDLDGIGETLEEKILALVETGEIPAATKLKEKLPAGLVEINRIPGLGPRRCGDSMTNSTSPGQKTCGQRPRPARSRSLKGLGAKTEQGILEGLDRLEAGTQRPETQAARRGSADGRELVAALREHPACERAEVAGSARRMADTCKDIDLIATSENPGELAAHIASHEAVSSAGNPSENGVKLVTHVGISVDVRIVAPAAFGNLLQHFTGSAAHNTVLQGSGGERRSSRLRTRDHRRPDRRKTEMFGTEQEVYERLGYRYIEPELRENRGELEAARSGNLPDLVERSQIRGDLHSHTTLSDGQNTLEEMAGGRRRGLATSTWRSPIIRPPTVSATGSTPSGCSSGSKRSGISTGAATSFRLLAGSEVNIHPDGTLDYEDEVLAELDWVVASIHTGFSRSASATTARMIAAIEHPEVDCIGHATGRLLTRREPYAIDIEAAFEAAARSGTAFEINGSPKRRDLSDIHARMAKEAGVKIVLNTDAHQVESLANMRYAVATARRAWLEAGDILNTGPWWK